MATMAQTITCDNFVFYNNFDSANLAKVEPIKITDTDDHDTCETGVKSCKITENSPDYEFNVWTKHDCHGTEFQNNNRTWFYFGIKSPVQGVVVKLNVVNLNRQSKMFSQGMCPVFKVIPGHPHWERIRDKPTYTMDQKGSEFTLSFTFHTPENPKAVIYVAFTYPFTYSDLQHYLNKIDIRMSKQNLSCTDAIYYHRECAIKSLEGRRLDVLTISSHHNISTDREARLMGMFPETDEERPFKFRGKRVIFVSARVHPGETPSSFVFNGFLNFLINREDPTAIMLRRIYVFKLIPMLNPDGVARGHYRMDTRGINLNRVYLNPSIKDHPTIFAARNLIRYYHNFYEHLDEIQPQNQTPNDSMTLKLKRQEMGTVTEMTLDKEKYVDVSDPVGGSSSNEEIQSENERLSANQSKTELECDNDTCTAIGIGQMPRKSEDSGLFLYVDLHGHASKKGVFMYGNYFDDPEDTIMCMLLPKLMSINNSNFHFTSCNFAERNMYLIDKRDGMSREGSGRVAVYKLTGLVRSYTLECNYNSGRLVNSIPTRVRDSVIKPPSHMFVPPKYTPTLFEEVGAALGPSILDLTNSNPNSRLPNSQYRSLRGVKSYLKLTYVNNLAGNINRPRLKPLSSDDNIGPLKASNCIDDIITSMNGGQSEETNNSQRSDGNIPSKSLIVRRTSSLYNAVKRIKSGKRSSRQLPINRKSLKNQRRMNNVENGTIVSKIRSSRLGVKTTMLKPIGQHLTADKNLCNIIVGKHHGKKTNVEVITEHTSIIKKGTKRFKLVSQQRPLKTRPEIGESSKLSSNSSEKSTQKTAKVSIARNKRVKGTFSRLKKSEQMKPRKSSSKLTTKI
ncbi:hypothetical protein PV328_003338 [Microctonus aethiopoides]|uniref:tubulin-glutamate carboxypeptidase n=1 Tax=Microctonus aethiopoides TaxID=144406 RepID=A0AA39F8C2_9HYME|nr:hypothetical protein PV328_003338 [Microctonus aethiopoides]